MIWSNLQQSQLEQVAEDYFQLGFAYLQRWRSHKLSGWFTSMFKHSHRTKMFPDVQTKHLVFKYTSIAFFPVSGHRRKEPGSILFTPSHLTFIQINKIPWASSFSGWKALALSTFPFMTIPLTIFTALHCTYSSTTMSFWYWGTQNWTKHSRYGFNRVEGKDHLSKLPAVPFLMSATS